MGRPKGKQVAVTCLVCGQVREWPPSKAKGKRYCSRECQFIGQIWFGNWSHTIRMLEQSCRLLGNYPDHPDPADRIRHVDGRVFLHRKGVWYELVNDDRAVVQRSLYGDPINEADIPKPAECN